MNKIDSIGFDLDGTLWDFTPMVVKCWEASLKKEPIPLTPPSLTMIRSNAGLMPQQYLPAFLPQIDDPKERMAVFERAMSGVYNRILEEGGVLYPGVIETLKALSSRYRLFIASNCESLYLQNFLQYYCLEEVFDSVTCFGLTGKGKGESIALLAQKQAYKNILFVGDTRADMDAASYAGATFVHAAYGFGQVQEAKYRITQPAELIGLLDTISNRERIYNG